MIAYIGCGKTISSVGQLELFNKNDVINPYIKVLLGGLQCEFGPDVEGMRTCKSFVHTLKDTIRFRDSPIKETVYLNELVLVVDPSRFVDRL